jgi:hypothetical protein
MTNRPLFISTSAGDSRFNQMKWELSASRASLVRSVARMIKLPLVISI